MRAPKNLRDAQREIVRLRRTLKERDRVIAEMVCLQFNRAGKVNEGLVARPIIDGEIVPDSVNFPPVSVEGIAFINSRTGPKEWPTTDSVDMPDEDETG